jgi:hypothetical protein
MRAAWGHGRVACACLVECGDEAVPASRTVPRAVEEDEDWLRHCVDAVKGQSWLLKDAV